MGQLTAEERRRAVAHRPAAALGATRSRAITLERFAERQRPWPRAARLGALLALAVVALFLLAQSARVVSLQGAPALIEWLLPRV
jgi:hypothetical protein